MSQDFNSKLVFREKQYNIQEEIEQNETMSKDENKSSKSNDEKSVDLNIEIKENNFKNNYFDDYNKIDERNTQSKNVYFNKITLGDKNIDNIKIKEYEFIVENKKNRDEKIKDIFIKEEKNNDEIINKNDVIDNYEKGNIIEKNKDNNKFINSISHHNKILNEDETQRKNSNISSGMQKNQESENFIRRRRGSSGITESEFFFKIRNENANKLRKEILKIQNRADKYFEKLFNVSNNFQEIRKNIYEGLNNLYYSMFVVFGVNWKDFLKNSNFFVLASEAWLIEVSRILENYIKTNLETIKNINNFNQNEKIISQALDLIEPNSNKIVEKNNDIEKNEMKQFTDVDQILFDYPKNFTFASVFKKICNLRIDEESYLMNLSIFTGSVYSQSFSSATTKLIENNLGKLFLSSLDKILHSFEFSEEEEDELDQKKFEILMMKTLRKAVEASLNIMNSQISGVKNDSLQIKYLESFDKLRNETKENTKGFSYIQYIKYLIKENQEVNHHFQKNREIEDNNTREIEYINENNSFISKDFSMKICAESFFDFSLYKFSLIIDDINIFINEYNSLNYRLKNFITLTMNKVYDYNKKYLNILKAIFLKIMKKIKNKINNKKDSLTNLYEYCQKKFPQTFNLIETQKENTKRNISFFKEWMNSSCKLIKETGENLFENFIYEKFKFISANLISPMYGFGYSISNYFIHFLIMKINKCSTCSINYKNKISRIVCWIINIIKKVIIYLFTKTIGDLELEEKIEFMKGRNDKNLFEFRESLDKMYLIVLINNKIIGNILYKIKSLRSDICSWIFENYKSIFIKAFKLPCGLINYFYDSRISVLEFLESKFNEIIESE